MQQEQLRLSKVSIGRFIFQEIEKQENFKNQQETEMRQRVIERLEGLNEKRSKEREKREVMQKEWEKRKREIDNTIYLHQKMNASIGISF